MWFSCRQEFICRCRYELQSICFGEMTPRSGLFQSSRSSIDR
jgi:hypothetical protein